MNRSYRSFEEFAREEIRPSNRIGFSLDELDIDTKYDEDLFFDMKSSEWDSDDDKDSDDE